MEKVGPLRYLTTQDVFLKFIMCNASHSKVFAFSNYKRAET